MGNASMQTIIDHAELASRAYDDGIRQNTMEHFYTASLSEMDDEVVLTIAIAGSENEKHWFLNVAMPLCQVLNKTLLNDEPALNKLCEELDFSAYMIVAEKIVKSCKEKFSEANVERYIFCGHSRGGRIAICCALYSLYQSIDSVIWVYTYNSPKLVLPLPRPHSSSVEAILTKDVMKALSHRLICVEHKDDPVCQIAHKIQNYLNPDAIYLQRHFYSVDSAANGTEAHSMLKVIEGLKTYSADIREDISIPFRCFLPNDEVNEIVDTFEPLAHLCTAIKNFNL